MAFESYVIRLLTENDGTKLEVNFIKCEFFCEISPFCHSAKHSQNRDKPDNIHRPNLTLIIRTSHNQVSIPNQVVKVTCQVRDHTRAHRTDFCHLLDVLFPGFAPKSSGLLLAMLSMTSSFN